MALAAGSVAGVAKAIEIGLARLIPLVIGLLASLIGLGGLSKKVMKIFKKIRKRIDKAVNKLLMKAKKAGRKLMRKLGIGKKGDKKKKEDIKGKKAGDGEIGEVVPFGQGHKLFINTTGGKITVISQSVRMPVVGRIKEWTDDANALEDADKKTKLLSLLSQAKGKLSDTEKHALKTEQLKDAKTDSEKAFIKEDNATEDSEKELAEILEEIYNLLDKQNDVQLNPIPVNFGPIPDKYDKAEYFSQLKGQEEGINAMNVHDWLSNRTKYSDDGRAASGNIAQANYRAQIFKVLVQLRLDEQKAKSQTIDVIEARTWAQTYIDSQAALHDPDQVAGGDPLGIAKGDFDSMMGLGNARINYSIGSRWKTRIDILHDGVNDQVSKRNITIDQQKETNMKSKLIM